MKKSLLFVFSLWVSCWAMADDRESFLHAWEAIQQQHTEVSLFEKLEENRYRIAFTNLPFDGELRVLAYAAEPMHYSSETDISLMGYVEVELVDAPEDMMDRYYRTYGRWSESLSLFYHQQQGQWLTTSQYQRHLSEQYQPSSKMHFLAMALHYWHWVLAIIIIYFFVSQLINSHRMKLSLALQQRAVEESLALQKEGLLLSKRAMEISQALHEESNRMLAKLVAEAGGQKTIPPTNKTSE